MRLSLKLNLKSHFLSEKDINLDLGEYGSISFSLFHEIFMNAPGLISAKFSIGAKSPLTLFLILRFKFLSSQIKFVLRVKRINIDEISEKIFLVEILILKLY